MASVTEHDPAAAHGHPPHLAHHFDTPKQQFESAVLGMWLFLATEILLFGGLFCAYAVYRAAHPEIFIYAHKYLDTTLGAVNTVILLCSSFTMAAAVWAVQHGKQRMLVTMLVLTILGAFGFLGIKYVEYKHKWEKGLGWGKYYNPKPSPAHGHGAAAAVHAENEHAETAPSESPSDANQVSTTPNQADEQPTTTPADSETFDPSWFYQPVDPGPTGLLPPGSEPVDLQPRTEVRNVHTFFGIYFAMTGLHGLHVIAGIAAIAWVLVLSLKGRFTADYFTPIPLVGLYWHVVDLIWIYLFPLLYLIH